MSVYNSCFYDDENKYVAIIEPTEKERKELIKDGFLPWKKYQSINQEFYGKEEELWIKTDISR